MKLARIRLGSNDVATVLDDFIEQFDSLSPQDRALAMHQMMQDTPDILRNLRDQACVEMYQSGMTVEDIADHLLIGTTTVTQLLRDQGETVSDTRPRSSPPRPDPWASVEAIGDLRPDIKRLEPVYSARKQEPESDPGAATPDTQ